MDRLWERIEESEEVIGAPSVDVIGPSSASVSMNVALGWTLADSDYVANLFAAPIEEDSVYVGTLAHGGFESEVAASCHSFESVSELARAA